MQELTKILILLLAVSIFHLRFRWKYCTAFPKTACGSRIAHGFVVGAVERREPESQLVVLFRCWLVFQLLQLVRQADESPLDHVALRSQPGTGFLVVIGRQVRRARYGE